MSAAEIKACLRKRVFFTRKAAEASGQRRYHCGFCGHFHRTGSVLPFKNPVLHSNFRSLQALNHKPKTKLMKNKPSDYQKLRYLKKENIPNGVSLFTITDFDEVDKSTNANQPDWRIRLTFDERWWFELRGGNLDTTIDLLGDNFQDWIGGSLGLRVVGFTTKDGEEREYIKIVPAPEIQPSANIKSRRQSAEKTKRDSVLTVKHVS